MNLYLRIVNYIKQIPPKTKKVVFSLFLIFSSVFLLLPFFFDPSVSEYDYTDSNFNVLGLNIPQNLEFCGEKVPQNDYEIKDDLEKEFLNNKAWKHASADLFYKSEKWFPLIEPILKREGVPDDFKYVAVIESHLTNVSSPMGAVGFWQLMPSTARNYGLIINQDIDERYDVEKSTEAACKHFKDAYNYFSNWTLAAAAYNVGIGGIQKALKKQNTSSYYDLLLNKETGSFIYRILAYKTLLSNPAHFGLNHKLKKTKSIIPSKLIKVDSTIHNLTQFAKHIQISIISLKALNPWLVSNKLNNPDKKTYLIKIPKNKDLDLSGYYHDLFPRKNTVTHKNTDTITQVNDTLKK